MLMMNYARKVGGAVHIADTFTGANGTDLKNRLPSTNIGNVWLTTNAGEYLISSNKASRGQSTLLPLVVDAGKADVDLTIDTTATWCHVVVRYVDDDNFWYTYGSKSATWAALALIKREAGSDTSYNIGSQADDVTNLRVVAQGNVIKVYYNGALVFTKSDASFQNTATKHGLMLKWGTGFVSDFDLVSL